MGPGGSATRGMLVALALAGTGVLPVAAASAEYETRIVSREQDRPPIRGFNSSPSVSSDGRFVAFYSHPEAGGASPAGWSRTWPPARWSRCPR